MGIVHIVDSEKTKNALHKKIDDDFEKYGYSEYSIKHGISKKQFSALHVYCQKCADLLNANGIDIKMLVSEMKQGFSVWHTKDTFKEMVYKPILKSLEGRDSTKDQSTVEPARIQSVIDKFLSERLGVVAPDWPSKEEKDR